MNNEKNNVNGRGIDNSKRSFVKKTAYLAPFILTLKAVPSFAAGGSGYNGSNERPPPQGPS